MLLHVQTNSGSELEVVVQAKTESYIGLGWKPRGKRVTTH